MKDVMVVVKSATPCPPLLCHRGGRRGRSPPWVTVPGVLSRDRCGRAAILGAVIDAGEHDQRADPDRDRRSPAAASRSPPARRCRATRRPNVNRASRRRSRKAKVPLRKRSGSRLAQVGPVFHLTTPLSGQCRGMPSARMNNAEPPHRPQDRPPSRSACQPARGGGGGAVPAPGPQAAPGQSSPGRGPPAPPARSMRRRCPAPP